MKTYKNLYPEIINFENLYESWRKARRGKQYKTTVAKFGQDLDKELLKLQKELSAESWKPGGYRNFTVHETKRRKISAAPFRDRIVHHALIRVIEPLYEKRFIFDSYANRVGKGTHRALDRCTEFMQQYKYVLPCDIEQFFPAIDHSILKSILAHNILCSSTMSLCNEIIDSGADVLEDVYDLRWFPNDNLLIAGRKRGLPIGNLTSQFWANVYMNELDQFVKHKLRCKAYLRYVDDFLLFANDKVTLHKWLTEIVVFLHSLRLTIHTNRAQPRPVQQGLTFLGFVIYPNYRLLKRSRGISYRRHLRNLHKDFKSGNVDLDKLNTSVMAWLGHVKHGDTWALRKSVVGEVLT